MIILGIDPGYAILGYGAVEAERGKIRVIDYGVVETTPKMTFPERLERLYAGTKLLLERYRPDHVAFEELFFYLRELRFNRYVATTELAFHFEFD